MQKPLRTVVTFTSSAFNASQPKDYFINSCCFGDDAAKWLAERLCNQGHLAERNPAQEDFGWYFRFSVSGVKHCFVIGHRPDQTEAAWIGWLERTGFFVSLLGRRTQGVQLSAARAVHQALSGSPQIQNIRWHLRNDFDNGKEERGATEP